MAQNNTQTEGHGNSMTESAQWGQFSEKGLWIYVTMIVLDLNGIDLTFVCELWSRIFYAENGGKLGKFCSLSEMEGKQEFLKLWTGSREQFSIILNIPSNWLHNVKGY